MANNQIEEISEFFPGSRRWAVFSRSPGNSLGLLIYDLDVSRDHPVYVLELPYQRLGFMLVMPDDKESVELIMTHDEFQAFIESGGKVVPPGFRTTDGTEK
jgi:hypothetical protein